MGSVHASFGADACWWHASTWYTPYTILCFPQRWHSRCMSAASCNCKRKEKMLSIQQSSAQRSAIGAFDLAYSALPWCVLPLMATKPVKERALRAAFTLETQSEIFL